MHVCLVLREFPLLSESFVLNHITGLIDRGIRVTILAHRCTETLFHSEVNEYQLPALTRYSGMPLRGISRIGRSIPLLITHLRRSDVVKIVKILDMSKYGASARNLELLYWHDLFRGYGSDVDIFHCHFGNNGNAALFMKEILSLNSKIVCTFHGSDISKYLKHNGTRIYRNLLARGDLILPISRFWQRKLFDLSRPDTPGAPIEVHHMGVCCADFDYVERNFDRNTPLHLISICRLVEKKGIEFGIRGLFHHVQAHPASRLVYSIIGDGPLRQHLEALVDRLGLGDRVRLVGSRTKDEVIRILNEAHVFVLPSVTAADGDMEGIPVSIMEAMAVGLPVLTTTHSGIPELVEDDRTGWLVPERDPLAIADRLCRIEREPERLGAMGRRGRHVIEADFNIEKLNDRLVERYHSLLGTKPPVPAL